MEEYNFFTKEEPKNLHFSDLQEIFTPQIAKDFLAELDYCIRQYKKLDNIDIHNVRIKIWKYDWFYFNDTYEKQDSNTINWTFNKCLFDVIGEDAFESFCNKYAGNKHETRTIFISNNLIRNFNICKDYCNGMPPKEIAEKYNLKPNYIYKILKQSKNLMM